MNLSRPKNLESNSALSMLNPEYYKTEPCLNKVLNKELLKWKLRVPEHGRKTTDNEEERPKSTKSRLQNSFPKVGFEAAHAQIWNFSSCLHFLWSSVALAWFLIARKETS